MANLTINFVRMPGILQFSGNVSQKFGRICQISGTTKFRPSIAQTAFVRVFTPRDTPIIRTFRHVPLGVRSNGVPLYVGACKGDFQGNLINKDRFLVFWKHC